VNTLDSTSITQSAILGTNVSCGGVYATDFSCGSTRRAPLLRAVGISLDGITYFSDDGLIVEGRLLTHNYQISRGMHSRQSEIDHSLIDTILVEFSDLKEENGALQEFVTASLKRVDARLDDNDSKVKTSSQSILVDVMISVFVVLVCGVMVFFIQKKRRN